LEGACNRDGGVYHSSQRSLPIHSCSDYTDRLSPVQDILLQNGRLSLVPVLGCSARGHVWSVFQSVVMLGGLRLVCSALLVAIRSASLLSICSIVIVCSLFPTGEFNDSST
jgi:hypothetical protein